MSSDPLAGFFQHGLHVVSRKDNQAIAVCPFCGKEKFYVNPTNLLWDCKVCGIAGNFNRFMDRKMSEYQRGFVGHPAAALCKNRGLRIETFQEWGVGWSVANSTYMVPMNGNPKRICSGIHAYQLGQKSRTCIGGKLDLFSPVKTPSSNIVWVAEGEWDGMAMWEMLKDLGRDEQVVASPGAGTFPKANAMMFRGLKVRIVFDNDEPGRKGAIRTGNILQGIAQEILYLHWPAGDNLPDGFDVRDLWMRDKDAGKALKYLESNLSRTPPSGDTITQTPQATAPALTPSDDWKPSGKGIRHEKVLEEYRQWLEINNPIILEVLFGAIFANRIGLDPLWLFIVAPPGGSKSELLMSLSDADGIKALTTMTPRTLISGANFGGADPSLIPKLDGKVLIIKDFTTILSMNTLARDEIFGTLRDAYDGKIEKYFGNGVIRNYSARFGIIAGVTPVIETLSSANSVLGERFIKYKIPQLGKIRTGESVIERALQNMAKETSMRSGLSQIAREVLSRQVDRKKDLPRMSDKVTRQLRLLAQFTASLRGVVNRDRYTRDIIHKPVQEIGTRLAKQLAALSIGIAIYRQEDFISEDVMRTIRMVARHTAPDRVEEIVKQIYVRSGYYTGPDEDGYFQTSQISGWSRFPQNTVSSLLQDLELLHITVRRPGKPGYWKLSSTITKILDESELYGEERRHAVEVHRFKSARHDDRLVV